MNKVSVIIPIYNVEKYLRECLDSVVGQTLQDIEIICIDDGSTDNSARIVAEYMERYDNIKLIRQENRGPSCARNAGLDIATGEYVYFLDSDDAIDAKAMEILYETASRGQLDVVYFNAVPVFENEKARQSYGHLPAYYSRTKDYSGLCTGQTMFARMNDDNKFLVSACLQLLRREFLEQHRFRFYPGILHEDNLFSFRCAMTAERVDYIADALFLRRVRDDSITTMPKSIRHVEGYLISHYEALVFLHGIPVQENALEAVRKYLDAGIFENACHIWAQLPEEEQNRAFSSGNVGAEQLLDIVNRYNHQRQRTQLLSGRVKTANAKIKKLTEENRRLRERGIRGLYHMVRACGLRYAVRKWLGNGRDEITDFLIAHSRGCMRTFFALAKERGRKYTARAASIMLRMKWGGRAPLVSFVLPVYNVAPYLEQSMECLLQQTLKHIEIICVDDGSTDDSLEILRRYEEKDRRVRVFTQKNQYAGVARNHGLGKARGEYVCFLDPDDFFEKTLAEDTYYAAKTADADAVIYDARYYDNVTKEIREAPWLLAKKYVPPKQSFNRNDCPETFFQITTPCPWTKLFRRQFLLDSGLLFPPLRNAEDVAFIYPVLAMAQRITVLDKVLVYYRVNVSTSLESTKAKTPLCFFDGYKILKAKLEALGMLEQLRRSYVNTALSGCMHNWQTLTDPEAKRVLEAALRDYVFRELEILDHEPDYYYIQDQYRTMQTILSETKEDSL